MFHADGRTEMTTLIVAFRSFANGPHIFTMFISSSKYGIYNSFSSSAVRLAKISRFVERQGFYQCIEKNAIEIFIKPLESSSLSAYV